MLREKFYLLFVILMFPFSWFNYLLAFLLFVYLILDKYVNYVIAMPDYVSCEVEATDDTDNDKVQFTLYSKKEYEHAIESKYSAVKDSKVIKYFYKGLKTVVYPVDKVYKKSEKIYLPYVVNKLDVLLWKVYCKICTFVYNLPPVKKLTNKLIAYVVGIATRRAIQMLTHVKKGQMSNKDKKNVTNALDKLANGKEVDENKLREMIEMLLKKLKTKV